MDADDRIEGPSPTHAHRRKLSAAGGLGFGPNNGENTAQTTATSPTLLQLHHGPNLAVPGHSLDSDGPFLLPQSGSLGNIQAYVGGGSQHLHHRGLPAHGHGHGQSHSQQPDSDDDKTRKAMLHSAHTTIGVTGFVEGYPVIDHRSDSISRPASPASVSTISTIVSVASSSTPVSSSPSSPLPLSPQLMPIVAEMGTAASIQSLLGMGPYKTGKQSPPPPYSYHGSKTALNPDGAAPPNGLPTFSSYPYPRFASSSSLKRPLDRSKGQLSRACGTILRSLCSGAGLARLLRYAIVVYVLGTVVFTTWHIIAGQMGWTSPAASALLAAQPGADSGVVTGQFTIDKDGNRATVVWSKDKPGVVPPIEVPSYKRPDAAARATRGGRKEPRFAPPRLGNLGAEPAREEKKPVLAQGRDLNKLVIEKKPAAVEEKKLEVPVKVEVPVVEKKSEKPVEPVKVEVPEKVAVEVPAPVSETVAVAGAGAGALVAAATSVGDGRFIIFFQRVRFPKANRRTQNPQAFSTLPPRTSCFPNCSSLP
jgi:hypothetical protein